MLSVVIRCFVCINILLFLLQHLITREFSLIYNLAISNLRVVDNTTFSSLLFNTLLLYFRSRYVWTHSKPVSFLLSANLNLPIKYTNLNVLLSELTVPNFSTSINTYSTKRHRSIKTFRIIETIDAAAPFRFPSSSAWVNNIIS